MAELLASCSAPVRHVCLLVRDVNNLSDVSDWDLTSSPYFNAGDALIFGVLPAVDGPVNVEVWNGRPSSIPENLLFSERVRTGSGRIVIDDPDGKIFKETPVYSGEIEIFAYVDDLQMARKYYLDLDSSVVMAARLTSDLPTFDRNLRYGEERRVCD